MMRIIDTAFVIYMIALVLYIQLTPGTQMIPPWWKPQERANWKPTMFFWVNMAIIAMYFILSSKAY